MGTENFVGAIETLMAKAPRLPPIALRVKEERLRLKLSQKAFANLVGMGQSGVSAIETGIVELPDNLRAIAQKVGKSEAYLLGETDDAGSPPVDVPRPNASLPPRYQAFNDGDVPIYGRAAGGPNGLFIMNGQKVGSTFCPPILDGVEGAYAVYVHGSSMEDRYFSGETVWLHPYLPVGQGMFVVAQIAGETDEDDYEGYVKQFVRRTSRELVLRQLNPPEGEGEIMSFPADRIVSVHKIVFSQSL
jgi:phage repressor protein C with HTH and peptisase S24 domain